MHYANNSSMGCRALWLALCKQQLSGLPRALACAMQTTAQWIITEELLVDRRTAADSEGRLGMSDVSPLSGTLLSPLLFFCLVLLLFLSYLFSACWSILLNFFQKILQIFFVKI